MNHKTSVAIWFNMLMAVFLNFKITSILNVLVGFFPYGAAKGIILMSM